MTNPNTIALRATLIATPRSGTSAKGATASFRVTAKGSDGHDIKIPCHLVGERARYFTQCGKATPGAELVIVGHLLQQGKTTSWIVEVDVVAFDDFPAWESAHV